MATAAGALAALLVGSGCTSDAAPEPAPLPSDPPSASDSPSPSATPPTLPPAADGTSAKAAKAFARHYVEVISYATASGDVDKLVALGANKCTSCADVAQSIWDVYDAGGSIESDGWRVESMSLVPGQPAERPIVDLGIQLSPQTVIQSAGAEPERFDGGKLPVTFYLAWREGAWEITRWDRAA